VCAFLVFVEKHDALETPKNVLKVETQLWIDFQTALKVRPQIRLASHGTVWNAE
jgi:hypothetical protein